jgi:hypothetical protein
MVTIRTFADIPDDRQIVVSLPTDIPVGRAELVVTIVPEENGTSPTADIRRRFGSVHSGDSRSADNEQIDADLANGYSVE